MDISRTKRKGGLVTQTAFFKSLIKKYQPPPAAETAVAPGKEGSQIWVSPAVVVLEMTNLALLLL
jgi:hypothetical protein